MADLPESLQRKLDTLTDEPGVYLWKDAHGDVLYVGKARRLRSRVRSYVASDAAHSPRLQLMVRAIADLETIVVANEAQSLLLENNLIKEHQPRFNVRLKDDKSYPSIAVTLGEPFPRVLVTRRRDLVGARYFGPYTDVTMLRKILAVIRRLYTVRSCPDDLPRTTRERPCLDYHINRCLAPCVGWQSREEYRQMIDEVVAVLEGRTTDLRGRVRAAMVEASERQDYERAKERRDQLRWLDQLEAQPAIEVVGSGDADVVGLVRDGEDAVGVFLRVREGRVVAREHSFLENPADEDEADLLAFLLVQAYIPMPGRVRRLILPLPPAGIELLQDLLPETQWHIPQRGTARRWLDLAMQNARHLMESLRLESLETDERAGDPVYALGRDLGLASVPRSMVCIDISTNQGKDTVGALVWFEAGRPRKSEYRRFRIKGPAQQDDYAAVGEVMSRFLTRRREEAKPMPDLIVIDGGKGQLSAALESARSAGVAHLTMVSLAKREEEVFFPDRGESLRLPRNSPSLQLLQRIRDETHRFGLAYNRQRRSDRTITSLLLDVPGIGPSRRRLLLERFGSLAGVRSASPAELAALPGFSLRLANRVLESLAES